MLLGKNNHICKSLSSTRPSWEQKVKSDLKLWVLITLYGNGRKKLNATAPA